MCAYSKGARYRDYGYVPLRFGGGGGGNVVRRMGARGKRIVFIVPFFYRGSGGRGPSRKRICYPRTKLFPVSVHSSLVVLHFAERGNRRSF